MALGLKGGFALAQFGLPGEVLISWAVQLFPGHTELESTVRYLGIEVDDALEMAEQTEI